MHEQALFSASEYWPHAQCLRWDATLVCLNAVSDALIALAYAAVPVLLFWFARRHRDLPFKRVFVFFSVLVSACAAAHCMALWTLWVPDYWLAASVNVLTAAIAVTTAVAFARLLPKALTIEGPQLLATAHAELAAEILGHERAKEALRLSETRFQRLVEAGNIGIVTADIHGGILEANAAFLHMLVIRPKSTPGARCGGLS